MRGGDDVPTFLTLPAVPFYFRSGASWRTVEVLYRDYGRYRGLTYYPDEARGQKAAEGFYMDAWLEEDLLWGKREMLVM